MHRVHMTELVLKRDTITSLLSARNRENALKSHPKSTSSLPRGFLRSSIGSTASPFELEQQLSGTLNDFPLTTVLPWLSIFLADK